MSDAVAWRDRVTAALARCERELDDCNAHIAGDLALAFEQLRRLLDHGRRARVVAIGRRGAGKSSVLNALAGDALERVGDVEDATRALRWHDLALRGRTIDWIDTPGLRAAGRPGRREAITRALRRTPPDVMLVLCQASEVDAGIDDDLADVRAIRSALERDAHGPLRVVGVVTKVDELAPPDLATPPFVDAEKRANIRRAVSVFGRHLTRAGIASERVIPTASYSRFAGGTVTHGVHWNIDTLAHALGDLLVSDSVAARRRDDEVRVVLDAVLSGLCDAVVAIAARSVAARARLGAAGAQASIDALQRRLGELLRAFAPDPRALDPASGWFAPDGTIDRVRGPFDALRAERASLALALIRMRLAGASARRDVISAVEHARITGLLGSVS